MSITYITLHNLVAYITSMLQVTGNVSRYIHILLLTEAAVSKIMMVTIHSQEVPMYVLYIISNGININNIHGL